MPMTKRTGDRHRTTSDDRRLGPCGSSYMGAGDSISMRVTLRPADLGLCSACGRFGIEPTSIWCRSGVGVGSS